MDRCKWTNDHALMTTYHDTEYGFPVENDNTIFERLMLEIYQAGLSWRLILEKRKGFNQAFHNFDISKVADMSDKELEKQRNNPEIVRNKLKISATRNNARVSLNLIEEHGSLLDYFKSLDYELQGDPKKEYKPVVKQMKKDGFKFIGPLILEEFFTSIGLLDVRHDPICFLHPNNK